MLAYIGNGFWLGSVVLECAGVFWFVTLPLLLLAAFAWIRVPDGEPRRFRAGWITLAVEGGAVLLLLAIGSLCARPHEGEPVPGALLAVATVQVAALVAAVMLPVHSKGQRFLALGTGLFGLWITLLAGFVAGMSVSGEWI